MAPATVAISLILLVIEAPKESTTSSASFVLLARSSVLAVMFTESEPKIAIHGYVGIKVPLLRETARQRGYLTVSRFG